MSSPVDQWLTSMRVCGSHRRVVFVTHYSRGDRFNTQIAVLCEPSLASSTNVHVNRSIRMKVRVARSMWLIRTEKTLFPRRMLQLHVLALKYCCGTCQCIGVGNFAHDYYS
jgi:hypothetical protein